MKRQDKDLDSALDQALEQIREQSPDPRFVEAATERVWQRLEQTASPAAESTEKGRIQSCSDFQTLLPAYLSNKLQGPRRLLLQDHLGECVTCRREFKKMRSPGIGPVAAASRKQGAGWWSTMGWRAAAAAVIFIAVVGVSVETDVFSFETGGLILVDSIQGELFRVTDEGNVPLAPGDRVSLEKGEAIRTAKGSSAMLTLADESQVEMRERSEVAVMNRRHLLPGRRDDGVIGLERGSIIVEASDQGSGHLYVDTKDCNVAVTGTVFAVNHGTKGSRVSVIEGEVHVKHGDRQDVLQPGEQTTTRASLNRIPVDQEIAWSQNSHEYLALLKEMRVLGRELDNVLRPELRYETDLLDLMPASTAIYVGIPNVSDEIGQAFEIVQQRASENEVLSKWWDEEFARTGARDELEKVIEKVRAYGDHLGEEVLLSVQFGPNSSDTGPLFVARVHAPAALGLKIQQDLEQLEESNRPRLIGIDGDLPASAPLTADGSTPEMYLWTRQDVLAVSPNYHQLRELDAVFRSVDGASLKGSAFHEQLAARYDEGVEWLVGFDLGQLFRSEVTGSDLESLDRLGLLDIQHVIAERKQEHGNTINRAVLTFDQPRRRLAAWLAEPAPLGAMNYISPEANLAVAFALKDADELVEELFEMISEADPHFQEHLAEFEQETGIDVRRDIAAPLGGEFAMALDGPVLPTPSWKMIVEVYDPARLQQSLEWLIEQVNQKASEAPIPIQGLQMETTAIGGRNYHRIQSLDVGMSVHYVFNEGYLIAGPSRGLLERAVQNRAMGFNLTDAPDFVRLLPQDGQVNFSGVFYHDLAAVLDPLSSAISATRFGDLGANDQQLLAGLAEQSKPALAVIYAEDDRITVFNTSEGGLFSAGLSQLSGFSGLLSMQQSLVRALGDGGS